MIYLIILKSPLIAGIINPFLGKYGCRIFKLQHREYRYGVVIYMQHINLVRRESPDLVYAIVEIILSALLNHHTTAHGSQNGYYTNNYYWFN